MSQKCAHSDIGFQLLYSQAEMYIYIYISRDSIAGLQELSEWVYVAPLHSKTHIWSAETFLTYLKFLEGEIRQRRKQLNLSLDDRCLILCDTACQHSSQKFKMLKDAWCEQHNVVLRLLFSVLHSLFPPISVSITFLCFPIQIYIYIYIYTCPYICICIYVYTCVLCRHPLETQRQINDTYSTTGESGKATLGAPIRRQS